MLVEVDNLVRWRNYGKLHGYCEKSVLNWIYAGRLPYFTLDGFYYVCRDAEVLPKKKRVKKGKV